MNEASVWQHLKSLNLPGHLDRIESHATSVGRPDVNYCIDGVTGDIELKFYDASKGGFVLRPSQNAWMMQRVRADGEVFILAAHRSAGSTVYLLIDGCHSQELIRDPSAKKWREEAIVVWMNQIDNRRLIEILTRTK
jgi:hypothetical protein